MIYRQIAFYFSLTLLLSYAAGAQAKPRTALILSPNSNFGLAEQKLLNSLTTKLVEGGQLELIDRQKIKTIMQEQDLQQTDGRFSPDSIVRLGKLLGIGQIIFVRVDNYVSTNRTPGGGYKTVYTLTEALKATVEVENVSTAAITATPTAKFEKTTQVVVTRTGPIQFKGLQIGGDKQSKVDPATVLRDLDDSAFDTVAQELSPKIVNVFGSSSVAPAQAERIPKVAGIRDGLTFLNVGSGAVKVGDKFRIVRVVESGFSDPDTHQPLMDSRQICVLTISETRDSLSSGPCNGSAAQSGDQAIKVSR